MTSQPVAYSSSSSSNVFKDTPGFGLAGGRTRSRVATSKRRLSDLHEKTEVNNSVNIQSSGAGHFAHRSGSATPFKKERRSLFEECQERLSGGSAEQAESSHAASLSQPSMAQDGQVQADCACIITSNNTDVCMMKVVPIADQHMSDSNQDSGTEVNIVKELAGADPSEVCSPVKRTPASEGPADDSFHRTFMPFDMLRSPTSLGGQSFKALNAHLAQNARLTTRQRTLRHDLRTATKEYIPEPENTVVASVLPWAAPAVDPAPPTVGPAPQGGVRMLNVSRGGVVSSSTLLNRGSGAGLISINRMAGASVMPAQNPPLRRCIF